MSIPSIGFSPFLLQLCLEQSTNVSYVNSLKRICLISANISRLAWGTLVCQFPPSGISHFYIFTRRNPSQLKTSVNSLKRVFSISTVSFHSPLKSRLSELIFAGNCLNILIIAFFSPIFCLFKNCTDINTICYVIYFNTFSVSFQ